MLSLQPWVTTWFLTPESMEIYDTFKNEWTLIPILIGQQGASDVYQIDIAVASETLFLAGGIHNSDDSNALDTLLAYIEEGN